MAQMTQEQIDQIIAQAGGSRLVHSSTVGKRKVPNPDYNKYDPKSQETIELDIQQWKSPEGYTIQAVQMPDGSWDVTQNEPPAKPPAASTTTRPAVPPGGSSETEGTPIKDANGTITGWDNNRPREVIRDANGTVIHSEELTGADLTAWRNNQQANQPQTGDKEEPEPNRPGWTRITRVVQQGGNSTTRVTFRGPDNVEVPTLPPDVADRVGKPTGNTRTRTENGQAIKETEYALPDGTTTWRSQTAPAEASAYGANIPAWTPDADADDYGLGERTRQLIALADAGKIPRESVAKQLEADRAQAEMAATARTRRETNERLARQQAETERAGRANVIGSAWQNAQEEPKGQEAYAGWNAPYRFAANMAVQNLYGGMGAWGQAAATTAPTRPAPGPIAPATPTPVVASAPVGPVAPQEYRAAQAAAAARPTPAGGPTFSTAGGGFMPTGSVAAPNAPPSIFDRTMPGTPPVNPAAGQPGNDPNAPVGMGPSPLVAMSTQPQHAPIPTGGHGEAAGLRVPGATFPFDAGRPAPIRNPEGVDVTNQLMPQPTPGPTVPWNRNMGPDLMSRGAWSDAAYGAGSTFDDTERNLIAEGFDPEVVRRVRQRREARLMGAMA